MITGMIGIYNCIVSSLNGQIQTHDIARRTKFSSTHNFCIKYGNESCHFVGNYQLKPIDYVALFNHREQSDAIIASIGSSNVSKTKNKYSTASYTSVNNTYGEVSGKISQVN